jgi:hypothetical protein
MPRVRTVDGVAIVIHYGDHPPPHVHAFSGGYSAVISIRDKTITEGRLPVKKRGRVERWMARHEKALLANFERAQRHERLTRIRG